MNTAISTQNFTTPNINPANPADEKHPKVLIYADGSCLKNGSPESQAGAGVVLMTEEGRRIKLKASYLGALTNQKAEILACAVGLESLKKPCEVKIFSDSKYVVETMLGSNRMKSNREFWERLIKACLTHKIEWNWVPRASGNAFQETADRLSRAAATRKENLDKGTLDRLALMMRGTPDENTVRMIHDGLKTLAAACDGAKKADGQGFNKFDSELGKRFAGKTVLTISEALFARGLMSKYRTQIAGFNTELALLV
ncbi:MAG TPA: reverse transcriptase-like protein [Pyrinomonadaceae bacterium]|nr:reverse transcriptase-like protein [Pyrinomonadaceae bacterium]